MVPICYFYLCKVFYKYESHLSQIQKHFNIKTCVISKLFKSYVPFRWSAAGLDVLKSPGEQKAKAHAQGVCDQWGRQA